MSRGRYPSLANATAIPEAQLDRELGAPHLQVAPYAATVAPDSYYDGVNIGALTGDITIANPAGTPVDKQALAFDLQQDATGSRAITWGNQYAFGTDVTAAMIPTAASSKWEMLFRWNAADAKWRCMAILRGF